jgi:hypothetical protein
MQDAPDKRVLLEAIAKMLATDVAGALSDPALAFRVRIAAHVLGGVSRELATEAQDDQLHLETLRALGFDGEGDTRSAIRQAEQALATYIRDTPLTDAELTHLAAVLRELTARKVRVGNPKFVL